MSELTHLSLFSGIGGLDLSAEWAGFRTVGQCEWADYPRAVLEKHWPGLPRWRDIRTLTGDDFFERTGLRTVTVLSGGFPCQPFSTAGKRRGKEDDRYLWPEMLRVIQEIRPTWVVGENVAGIVSMALDTVLSDLESIGYACQAFVIPACAVDAPHRRDRVAIVGYAEHNGLSAAKVTGIASTAGGDKPKGKNTSGEFTGTGLRGNCAIVANSQSERCGEAWECFVRPTERAAWSGAAVANASGKGLQGREQHGSPDQGREAKPYGSACECGSDVSNTDRQMRKCRIKFGDPARECGFANDGWWPAEPNVGRVANGVPYRVDRLKCLGNAVVPQQFHPIFRAIADLEGMT